MSLGRTAPCCLSCASINVTAALHLSAPVSPASAPPAQSAPAARLWGEQRRGTQGTWDRNPSSATAFPHDLRQVTSSSCIFPLPAWALRQDLCLALCCSQRRGAPSQARVRGAAVDPALPGGSIPPGADGPLCRPTPVCASRPFPAPLPCRIPRAQWTVSVPTGGSSPHAWLQRQQGNSHARTGCTELACIQGPGHIAAPEKRGWEPSQDRSPVPSVERRHWEKWGEKGATAGRSVRCDRHRFSASRGLRSSAWQENVTGRAGRQCRKAVGSQHRRGQAKDGWALVRDD